MRTSPRSTACTSLLVATLLIAGLFAPGGAAAQPAADNAQDKRNDVKAQRGKVVSQLDVLKASDVELQLEVTRLGNVVKNEETNVALARVGLVEIEGKLGGLSAEVSQARQDADVAQKRARDRAVLAYMAPGVDSLTAMLEANDYDEAHRRRTMIGSVSRFDQEMIQGNVEAQHRLAAKQDRLSDAQRRADDLKHKAETALGDARSAQAKQVELKQALDSRILDFQSEADALAAEEANLSAVIARREAEARAAAAAATTTTRPPTTLPAPGSTLRPPGGTGTTIPGTPTTTRPGGIRLMWPLSGPVTSPFGSRWGRLHAGIDIGVPTGTPIKASASGTVFFCGVMGGYGNVVLIDHGNGMVTLYAHQQNLTCANGAWVSAGQQVGLSGNTGHSTGPHLHFEVRVNGTPVDPMQYLG